MKKRYSPRNQTGWYAERNRKVCQMYRDGISSYQIGLDVNLSVSRINVILNACNIDAKLVVKTP